MTTEVLFFASLREEMELESLKLDIGEPVDGAGLLELLSEFLSAEKLSKLSSGQVTVAINQAMVDQNFLVRDGDEVAFLPPITGG